MCKRCRTCAIWSRQQQHCRGPGIASCACRSVPRLVRQLQLPGHPLAPGLLWHSFASYLRVARNSPGTTIGWLHRHSCRPRDAIALSSLLPASLTAGNTNAALECRDFAAVAALVLVSAHAIRAAHWLWLSSLHAAIAAYSSLHSQQTIACRSMKADTLHANR